MAMKTAAELNTALDSGSTAKTTTVIKFAGAVSSDAALYYAVSVNDVHGASDWVAVATVLSTASAATAITSGLRTIVNGV